METIDPPRADHDLSRVMPRDTLATAIAVAEQVPVQAFLEETTSLSSATALAVAEPVQARAETIPAAHGAAIIPFPVPEKTESPLLATCTPLLPPSVSVPEAVRIVVSDVILAAARTKNVPIEPDEAATVTTAVLDAITVPERYQLVAGNPVAVNTIGALISARLDDVAAKRLMRLVAPNEATVDDLVTVATTILERTAARQKEKGTMVWPDLAAAVADYYRTTPRGPIVDEMPEGVLTTYWLAGDLHRDPKEGLARHYTDGTREWSEYWVNGVLHRPSAEGPAFTYSHCEGREVAGEEFFEHGLWHRPAVDGPAIRHLDRDGTCLREVYYQRGERHRDSKEGPAWRGIENDESIEEYVEHDVFHRDEADGPAVIGRDAVTGESRKEIYYCNGQLHRENGAAETYIGADGIIIESWYKNGVSHRDPTEGPALIIRDPDGALVRLAYYRDGLHSASPDGPTDITFYSANTRCEEYWGNDGLHRDPSEGPAVVWRDESGAVTETEYWFNGVKIMPPSDSAATSGDPPAANRRARRAARAARKAMRNARRRRS